MKGKQFKVLHKEIENISIIDFFLNANSSESNVLTKKEKQQLKKHYEYKDRYRYIQG